MDELYFFQQPTFEDGVIELARPEMLAQIPLNDNKNSLAMSLDRLSDNKHSLAMSLDRLNDNKHSLAMSLDRLTDNKHSLAVSLSLGNTLLNLNKVKCPQCRKVRFTIETEL